MRVRFDGRRGEGEGLPGGESHLRPGDEYVVLEVFVESGHKSYFRIESEEGAAPPLFDVRLFSVTSGTIPRHWEVSLHVDGSMTFGPKEWSRQGFWEAYFDRENWAVHIYENSKFKSINEA